MSHGVPSGFSKISCELRTELKPTQSRGKVTTMSQTPSSVYVSRVIGFICRIRYRECALNVTSDRVFGVLDFGVGYGHGVEGFQDEPDGLFVSSGRFR